MIGPNEPTTGAIVRTDRLDALVSLFRLAVKADHLGDVRRYTLELNSHRDDPACTQRIEAAFAYPFDKGIPRYRSARWEAIHIGSYPLSDFVDAVNHHLIPVSSLNHDQRRSLGFRLPLTALERYSL